MGQRTTYSWDVEDRVVEVRPPGGADINEVVYFGDGKRYAYTDSDMVRTFLWDGENIVRQTLRDYTYNPQRYGELISQSGSFHHFDALGSTMQMTDGNEAVTNEYLYRAFGEETDLSGGSAVPNRFRWVGRLGYYWQPDLGNYWLRARIYDPQRGRFVSRDVLLDWNRYAYPPNSPLWVDPSGEQPYRRQGPHGTGMWGPRGGGRPGAGLGGGPARITCTKDPYVCSFNGAPGLIFQGCDTVQWGSQSCSGEFQPLMALRHGVEKIIRRRGRLTKRIDPEKIKQCWDDYHKCVYDDTVAYWTCAADASDAALESAKECLGITSPSTPLWVLEEVIPEGKTVVAYLILRAQRFPHFWREILWMRLYRKAALSAAGQIVGGYFTGIPTMGCLLAALAGFVANRVVCRNIRKEDDRFCNEVFRRCMGRLRE